MLFDPEFDQARREPAVENGQFVHPGVAARAKGGEPFLAVDAGAAVVDVEARGPGVAGHTPAVVAL